VWRVDLGAVTDDLLELLSAGERARAERMARVHDRALRARSRGVLRAFLGRYLHTDPRTLRLIVDDRGKPALDPERTTAGRHDYSMRLSFNLSHSGEMAVYAFTRAGPVGIDIEVARRAIDTVAIAARAFGPAEAARLRELDPKTRDLEFLRAWVRHEAALKCVGVGLGGSTEEQAEPAPWIAQLEMGERTAAAVAVSALPSEVRCWDWVPGPSSGGSRPAGG
jgi:4'-phosphopantetheinyl transferase